MYRFITNIVRRARKNRWFSFPPAISLSGC